MKKNSTSGEEVSENDLQFLSILVYEEMLKQASDSNSEKILVNSSILHAVLIFTKMLRNAIEKNYKVMNMFCGTFSILRDGTQKKVEKELEDMQPKNEELKKKWETYNPYKDFKNALGDYFNGGGVLRVAIENQGNTGFEGESMWPDMVKWIKNGNLIVRKCRSLVHLDHFTYVGDSLRVEISDKQKAALYCYKSKKVKEIYEKSFKYIWDDAVPYSINQ